MNDEQKQNVESIIKRYESARIVAGFDNDTAGEGYTAFLREKAAERKFERLTPELKDWNDDLRRQI